MKELSDEQAEVEEFAPLDGRAESIPEAPVDPIDEFPDISEQPEVPEQPQALDDIDGVASAVDGWAEVYRPRWDDLDTTGRSMALANLERSCAGLQNGRAPVEIRLEDMRTDSSQVMPEVIGKFDRSNETITVHDELSFEDTTMTVVHEGRHAYQHWAVETSNGDPRAAAWERNFDDGYHEPADGIEDYRSQPLEDDAWAYESRVATRLEEQDA